MWADCLRLIKGLIGDSQCDRWFGDITSMGFENGQLRLLVPSSYLVEYIEGNYLNVLGQAIKQVYGPGTELHYHYNVVKNEPTSVMDVTAAPRTNVVLGGSAPVQDTTPFQAPQPVVIDPQLNFKYTFENYCASESNKVALNIAQTVADHPDRQTFNPLFLFGPTGVGKTHLIQAIGVRIKERDESARVLYVSARSFESQFTTAVSKGETNKFFNFYQSIHTLIIDDIQELNNKPRTQNTFFNIFNYLYNLNRQIIFSSDRAPADMEGFEDRLLGRFKWGTSIGLEQPDAELRRKVLLQKAAQEGVKIPDEVISFIANHVDKSIRDLEGVLVSLVAHSTVLNCPISIELAQKVVSNAVKINKKQINFEIVAREVAAHYNIDADLLFTKSRKREISDARQILMYLAKKHAKMPMTAIGARLGRTHATVIYACKSIEERLQFEKPLQTDIAKIESGLCV
jgi:chromosomal replication initiator protein